jgi:multiple antibiotic resistance protein
MEIISAATLLFLVMDPLGNIPIFLSVLEDVAPERRTRVLLRELVLAFLVLVMFLFFGQYVLGFLQLSEHSIRIAGGIILFLIALKMVFPALLARCPVCCLAADFHHSSLSQWPEEIPRQARAHCDGAAYGNAADRAGRADAAGGNLRLPGGIQVDRKNKMEKQQ